MVSANPIKRSGLTSNGETPICSRVKRRVTKNENFPNACYFYANKKPSNAQIPSETTSLRTLTALSFGPTPILSSGPSRPSLAHQPDFVSMFSAVC
ncbi:hypothetical protein CDAR_93391 [Caerostris darwini]|uniref:Uncharacterized protein n=1 Tax=Caerostris darwini TaxID=1538125 RepID=A0AAV4QE92_9ARAC|nr:hypothetical protein CDAR_93391 [Caerostris darwini]